jgi:hypothetical protein
VLPRIKPTTMNVQTAASFKTLDQNSSSAKPRTPNALMTTIAARNMVIQTPTLTSSFQYPTVKPATTSSSGKTMAHWKA